MLITVQMTGDIPIYQQIRDQIVLGVAAGKLKGGDPLPSVRSLADELGVNPMTVQKAYTLLKTEGILEIDRRRGVQISTALAKDEPFSQGFDEQLTLLFSQAITRGASIKDLEERIRQILDALQSSARQKGEN